MNDTHVSQDYSLSLTDGDRLALLAFEIITSTDGVDTEALAEISAQVGDSCKDTVPKTARMHADAVRRAVLEYRASPTEENGDKMMAAIRYAVVALSYVIHTRIGWVTLAKIRPFPMSGSDPAHIA